MNLVTNSIKQKLRDNLADIGECKNSIAIAYTAKKSVHAVREVRLSEKYFDALGDKAAEDMSVEILASIVRGIDATEPNRFVDATDKQIMFRALEINVHEGIRQFYVRCVTESKSSPDLINDMDEIKLCDVI